MVKSRVGPFLTLEIDTSNVPSSTSDILDIDGADGGGHKPNVVSPRSNLSKSPKSMTSFNMQSVPWHELTEEEKTERREKARKRALQRDTSARLSSSVTRSSLLSLMEDEVCVIFSSLFGVYNPYRFLLLSFATQEGNVINMSPRARAQANADKKYKEMMKPRCMYFIHSFTRIQF